MFGTVVKEAGGLLDRRFFLNSLLPVLVFLAASAATAAAGTAGLGRAATRWEKLSATEKTLAVMGFAIAAMLLAAWISSTSTTLIRLYGGYWRGPLGRRARGWGLRWHRRRRAALDPRDPDDYARLHTDYPAERELMPTRLGNILKNSELHPETRYGIDAALTWPRLFPLLPAEQRAVLVAARTELEFFLTISTLAAAFSLGSGVFLAAAGASPRLFLFAHGTGAALAVLAYLGALSPARLYGQHVKVTFDVYRLLLAKALNQPLPADPDEFSFWTALARLWYRAVPVTTTYRALAAAPSSPAEPPPVAPPPRFALPLTALAVLFFLLTGGVGVLLLR